MASSAEGQKAPMGAARTGRAGRDERWAVAETGRQPDSAFLAGGPDEMGEIHAGPSIRCRFPSLPLLIAAALVPS